MCVCSRQGGGDKNVAVCGVSESEDNFMEFFLSFHFYGHSEIRTQVIRLAQGEPRDFAGLVVLLVPVAHIK